MTAINSWIDLWPFLPWILVQYFFLTIFANFRMFAELSNAYLRILPLIVCKQAHLNPKSWVYLSNLGSFTYNRVQILKLRFLAEIKKQYWDIWESRAPISIFNGDIIKNWGKVGERLLFWQWKFGNFSQIFANFDMKKTSNLKILFLMNQYYPRLYWSTIEKIFIPQTCRTREGFVKLVKIPIFEAKNLIQLLSPSYGT